MATRSTFVTVPTSSATERHGENPLAGEPATRRSANGSLTHMGGSSESQSLVQVLSTPAVETDVVPTPQSPPTPPKPPGKMKWRQGRLLGAGAFGQVYLGMDETNGRLIAAKLFTFNENDDGVNRRVAALQREIQIMKKLKHENVVNYLGADRSGENEFFIFMEYVPGGSLLGLLQDCGALAERTASLYTAQILTGVAFLHEQKVVHRDIKCANVLITVDGVIKLADFGSAHIKENNSKIDSMEGTANWMAPEVIRNEPASYASDIWSIGCTLLEMLTGKPPWYHLASNTFRVMNLVALSTTQAPPLPPDLFISMDCLNFLALCLEPSPNNRPTARSLMTHPFVIRHLASASPVPEAFQADFYVSMSASGFEHSDANAPRRVSLATVNAASLTTVTNPVDVISVSSGGGLGPPAGGDAHSPFTRSLSPAEHRISTTMQHANGSSLSHPRPLSAADSIRTMSIHSYRGGASLREREGEIARTVSTLSQQSLKNVLSEKEQQSILNQVFGGSGTAQPGGDPKSVASATSSDARSSRHSSSPTTKTMFPVPNGAMPLTPTQQPGMISHASSGSGSSGKGRANSTASSISGHSSVYNTIDSITGAGQEALTSARIVSVVQATFDGDANGVKGKKRDVVLDHPEFEEITLMDATDGPTNRTERPADVPTVQRDNFRDTLSGPPTNQVLDGEAERELDLFHRDSDAQSQGADPGALSSCRFKALIGLSVFLSLSVVALVIALVLTR